MSQKPKRSNALSSLVVVKHQLSKERGPLFRVCVFVNGYRLIRPGFHNKKSAIKLAAMLVQQMLVNGCETSWKVYDENGKLLDINLAALGSKMQRGEKAKASPSLQKSLPSSPLDLLGSSKETRTG